MADMNSMGAMYVTLGMKLKGVQTSQQSMIQMLSRLDKEVKQLNNRLLETQVRAGAAAKAVETSMTKAGVAMTTFGSSIRAASMGMRSFGWLATTVFTAPILMGATAVAKMGREFEFAMAKIEGLVGISKGQVDAWTQSLLHMAKVVAIGPQELADTLYYVSSAGFKTQQALEITEMSAKGAATGLGETRDIANFLTSAMNAYRISGMTAARAMDVLTASVREGKGEPAEMSRALGTILPIAAQLGVSLDQVGGALASMTLITSQTSNAATYLRNVLMKLMRPSKGARDTFKNMGTSMEELQNMLRSQGLMPTLVKLRQLTEQYGESVSSVFPEIRALLGMLNLTGQNLKYNEGVMAAVTASMGDFDKAFFIASQTVAFKWNAAVAGMKSSLTELGVVLAQLILPIMEKWIVRLQNIIDWFNELSGASKKLIVTLAELLAIMGPLTLVLSTFGLIFGTGIEYIGKLIKYLGGLAAASIGVSTATKVATAAMTTNAAATYVNVASKVKFAKAARMVVGASGAASAAMSAQAVATTAATAATTVLSATLYLIPFVAVAAGVWLVVRALIKYNKQQNEARKITERTTQAATAEVFKLGFLYEKAMKAAEGSKERADAINDINDQYGPYLKNVQKETDSNDVLAQSWDNARVALYGYIKVKELNMELSKQEEKLAGAYVTSLGQYTDALGEVISPERAGEFEKAVKGVVDQLVELGNQPPAIEDWTKSIGGVAWTYKPIKVSTTAEQKSLKIITQLYDAFFKDLEGKAAASDFEKLLSPDVLTEAVLDYVEAAKLAKPALDAISKGLSIWGAKEKQVTDGMNAVNDVIIETYKKNIISQQVEDIMVSMREQELAINRSNDALRAAGQETNTAAELMDMYKGSIDDLITVQNAYPESAAEAAKYAKEVGDTYNRLAKQTDLVGETTGELKKQWDTFSGKLAVINGLKALGIEFDYAGRKTKLFQETWENLVEEGLGGSKTAKWLASELQTMEASTYPVTQSLKEMNGELTVLKNQQNLKLPGFEINAENYKVLESHLQEIMQYASEAKNIGTTKVNIDFVTGKELKEPISMLEALDLLYKDLITRMGEARDAGQAVVDKNTIDLLNLQANAFKTVGAQVDILNYMLEAAGRNLRKMLQEQMAGTKNFPTDQIEKAVKLLRQVEIAYITLQGYEKFKYLESVDTALHSATNETAKFDHALTQLQALMELTAETDPVQFQEYAAQFRTIEDALYGLQKANELDYLSNVNKSFKNARNGAAMLSGYIAALEKDLEVLKERQEYGSAFTTLVRQIEGLKILEEVGATITDAFDQVWAEILDGAQNMGDTLKDIFKGIARQILSTLTRILVQQVIIKPFENVLQGIIEKGKKGGKDVISNFAEIAASKALAQAKAYEALATAVASAAAIPFPGNLASMPLAASTVISTLAAGAAGTTAISAMATKFAHGGEVPPGYPNDKFPAMLTSGEVVIPKEKVKDPTYIAEILDVPGFKGGYGEIPKRTISEAVVPPNILADINMALQNKYAADPIIQAMAKEEANWNSYYNGREKYNQIIDKVDQEVQLKTDEIFKIRDIEGNRVGIRHGTEVNKQILADLSKAAAQENVPLVEALTTAMRESGIGHNGAYNLFPSNKGKYEPGYVMQSMSGTTVKGLPLSYSQYRLKNNLVDPKDIYKDSRGYDIAEYEDKGYRNALKYGPKYEEYINAFKVDTTLFEPFRKEMRFLKQNLGQDYNPNEILRTERLAKDREVVMKNLEMYNFADSVYRANTPKVAGLETGGGVPPGYPNDTYPAMLTSGEIVMPDTTSFDNLTKSIQTLISTIDVLGGSLDTSLAPMQALAEAPLMSSGFGGWGNADPNSPFKSQGGAMKMSGQEAALMSSLSSGLNSLTSTAISGGDMGKAVINTAGTMGSTMINTFLTPALTAAMGPLGMLIGPLIGSLTGMLMGKGMAMGGIVPPGYKNDSYHAMLSSGEAVIPLGKMGDAFGETDNVVEFRIKGDDLVGIHDKRKKTKSKF